jgi:RES domain-containing protein
VTIWRISNHATLDGGGGLRASNRWHTRGRRVVYCAPNPATALLEILVHAEIELDDIPVTYIYLEIHVPERTSRESITTTVAAQQRGDAWLQQNRSALLLVPCVIVPATMNVLINPRHPDSARIKVKRIHEQTADTRLTSPTSIPPA